MASLPNNLIMRIVREACAEETHKSKLKPCLSQIEQVYNSCVERYGSPFSTPFGESNHTEHYFTYHSEGYCQYGEGWYMDLLSPNLPYDMIETDLNYGSWENGVGPTEEQNKWLIRVFGVDWLN